MKSTGFLPKVIAKTDEFHAERTSLLMIRSLMGLTLGLVCTSAAIVLVYLRGMSDYWGYALISMLLYILPMRTCYEYIKSKPLDIQKQKSMVLTLTRRILFLVLVWSIVAMFILVSLDAETRIIVICLFIASVFAHFLPFTL
ncbi:MAG: hypothetical protein P1U57_08895, partial [Oleibacter sp.]|nr:hypothetical protein [Thalassolituus sp.]